jgi:arylsulfatase A-like enzyme
MIARYWGLNSLIDTHSGAILDALGEYKVEEKTIVVFTSDHGDMMGSHRLLTKGVMYREATQVPLLVRLPGQGTTGRITGPVSHIDLVPTLLDLMGQPVPEELPGRSLRTLLEEASTGKTVSAAGRASDCVIVWHGNRPVPGIAADGRVDDWILEHTGASAAECAASARADTRTLVTPEGWRLTRSPAGEHELYNLNEDPLETRSLAGDPGHASIMSELTERLRAWQVRSGDEASLG